MELQSMHNRLLRFLEKVASHSKILTMLYIWIQDKIVLEEFSTIPSKKIYNVLIIGCGSIPNTAITLARAKRWNVVGIDRDKDAVIKAKRVVKMYKLENIDIKYLDGKDVDLEGFDLIIVALGVEPKREILSRVFRKARSGTYIAWRNAGYFSMLLGREEMDIKGLKLFDRRKRKDGTETIIVTKI